MSIHSSAIIHPSAELHPTVAVGAYACIGPDVVIDEGTEVHHHAVIEGPTKIGKKNRLFPFCAIGMEPQDKKYRPGEDSRLTIGDGNTIREYATINRGTETGGGLSSIGSNNWLMAYTHIAHDCHLKDNIVMANGTTLGGHVEIYNNAILGGMTGVHQFCRIGEYAITGGQSMISQDIAPFVIAAGNRAKTSGINYIGLERNGFGPTQVEEISRMYRFFFLTGLTKDDALAKIEAELAETDYRKIFVQFIADSQRGICRL